MHYQKPRLLGQGTIPGCVVQNSAAITAVAALLTFGVAISTRL
jgi:hypothetical protein